MRTLNVGTVATLLALSSVTQIHSIDPKSRGGLNIDWNVNPNPEHISQLLGWRDLQGMRMLKPDDSHAGDRFGRTVVLHGDHLIVGADYSTCRDTEENPGGVCKEPGKGAVYIFEKDYVTAPYYRWSEFNEDTTAWGGYPTSSSSTTYCDFLGQNCRSSVGFCTDSNVSSTDGVACDVNTPCNNSGTCRYAPPFTVTGSRYWGQRIKLQPSDLTNEDRFGSAISFDGETNTLVVGAPLQSVPGRCGARYLFGIREGQSGNCIEGGAVYVFQKDFGGMNNWGQVAKFLTTPGSQLEDSAAVGSYCASGKQSPADGNGYCPGVNCKICSSKSAGLNESTHLTHQEQHFGAAVSISNEYIAVGCPRCNGNNKCQGRCLDGSTCGRCNITATECIQDDECPTDEFCQTNRCLNGEFCTLWSLEQHAGKVFLYKNTGNNTWKYIKEVTPQPTGGFDELQYDILGGNYCGNYAQGVCGTDGTVVCTTDGDCALDGGICAGGSNGGNACTSDAQCPGTGRCTTACGGLNIDVLLWTCCRDGENFGGSVSVYYDAVEGDHILAVGAAMESTSVTFGESYDRRNHGTVYLFQQNLCCFNGSTPATSGASCGYPESTSDCADTWGQVKGILSSGRPHQDPVAPTTTCSKIDYNGNMVPWVSPFTENLLQFYCWHTEKISAIDEDLDTYFGRQVYLAKCNTYLARNSTCLMVTRGKLYADELYVYVRNKPGYILSEGTDPSGTGTGFINVTQYEYGSDFKNQWALHRKHCDENYQCPPTDNSGEVRASTTATSCFCNGGFRAGEFCNSDQDCQSGNQIDANYSFSGNCHDGQDNFGAQCTYACECSSGLLCSWDAGSLGGEATGVPSLRWTYSTTLAAAIPATCPGGVTDSGRITAVESGNVVKLSPSAAPFAGIYVGFRLEITTLGSFASGEGAFNTTEVKVIVGYTSNRVVTVSSGFGTTPSTSSTYRVLTSATWSGYPTANTECPGFYDVFLDDSSNLQNGSYILIDDEIFQVVGSGAGFRNLTTRRARAGTIVASHAVGAAVHIISGTGLSNFGIAGSDNLLAALQAGASTQTGGILRRCATITLDPFKADDTDNIYRNWYIAITSGVGVAQSARILHYDGDLKLAVIDCVQHGQEWTGYAQAGYSSGYTGQGYGEFSSSGNVPVPCRRSWITPPAFAHRYYRLRVLKANSGWTKQFYSPGFNCIDCCLATGWSIQEIQLFEETIALTPTLNQITIVAASNPSADGIVSPDTSSASFAIDGCPSAPGTTAACPTGEYPSGDNCDSNAIACGSNSTAFYQLSYNGSNCAVFDLPPLILDLGAGGNKRVDKYRFATTLWDSGYNHEPLRWVLEGTSDGTAAGGDAYDPYGFCGAGLNLNSTGSCRCSAIGTPFCTTAPDQFTPNCFCRSRWNLLHDMAKLDYIYSANEEVRGGWVPDADKALYDGYFSVPRSTYQLCQTFVDSNGVCNQGPCTEVACAGPTGDVDPLATDYLKQAKAYARQYQPNTNVKGNRFETAKGRTAGGALGGDVTGKPMWGNPISADRASEAAGRSEDDLMAIGDYSYDNKGAVFLMNRMPFGDYLSYFERYDYFPMPLPSYVD